MSAYLIHTADSRVLDTLETLLGALLSVGGGRKGKAWAGLATLRPQAPETSPGVSR
jgi:hypothetical protein